MALVHVVPLSWLLNLEANRALHYLIPIDLLSPFPNTAYQLSAGSSSTMIPKAIRSCRLGHAALWPIHVLGKGREGRQPMMACSGMAQSAYWW